MKKLLPLLLISLLLLCVSINLKTVAGPGDKTVVQTFYYDTTMRAGTFNFPSDTSIHYEKIIMLYSMRCKGGLVSTTSNRNLGCGEWDYNCYTFVVDSSQTDSLRTVSASHTISGSTDTVYNYTSVPQFNYIQYDQHEVTYSSVISETSATVGVGALSTSQPFEASEPISRSQFLWLASELSGAGFTADSITGLRLDLTSLGTNLNNLRIRIKTTSQDSLNAAAPELLGFTETYFLNTSFSATGMQDFNFHTPFWWNGISNLLIEFSYTNASSGTDNILTGTGTAFNSSLNTSAPDNYLSLNSTSSVLEFNDGFFNSISNEISIAFWVYGDPAVLPKNTYIMEAVDSANSRQLNIHLPWSDSNIYWDCGNDGTGYDRINKLATANEISGRWNFWTFTKNASTGSMQIYLNGNLWHSGTGKTKPMDIRKFLAGINIAGNAGYYGKIDELSVWNKALSQASIKEVMYADISPSHPDYASLQVYHQFNETTGNLALDAGASGLDATLINPTRQNHIGSTLFRNFSESMIRPNIDFVSGEYVKSIQTTTVLDSFPVPAASIISYNINASGHDLDPIDTVFVWNAGYSYTYSDSGTLIDSVAITAEDTLHVGQLTYYRVRPMYMELINFITPYGINLNLNGLNGLTWAFDVTDFAPILHGPRHMEMRDGLYQEEMDIKFVFVEGTPPRDVKSISQIWPSGSWVSPSYNEILSNKYFESRDLTLDAAAAQFKIRSAISGHGQEGEFIPRSHTIRLNNAINYSRNVWRDCATNPIYPQGGTWIYDRAGWCPGAAIDLKEYDITPDVTPGQNINLDYSLPNISNPGQSNYRINNQLVSYGAPNFTLDATLDYIKSPSKRVEFLRTNPLCNQPVVAIKNTGSTPLTSLTITYGRKGGTLSTYNWSGNLMFLQGTEVTLPQPAWLTSGIDEFVAYISAPNGGTDQYLYNDSLSSPFNPPAQLSNYLVFELKTNNLPGQNSYTLRDAAGNIIHSRSSLSPNILYQDTLMLASDCFSVSLFDSGGDGLSFWNNPSQGNGYFRILNANTGIAEMSFNPDFGDNIYQQFTTGFTLPVLELNEPIRAFNIYPNPASDIINTEFSMPLNSQVKIQLVNMLGEIVLSREVMVTQSLEKYSLDVTTVENGIYYVLAESRSFKETRKVVIAR